MSNIALKSRKGTKIGLSLAPVAGVLLFVALASRLFELVPGARLIRPTVLAVVVSTVTIFSGDILRAVRFAWKEPTFRWFFAFIAGCFLSIPTSIWISFSIGKIMDLLLVALLFGVLVLIPAKESTQRAVEKWCVASMAAYAALFLMFAQEGWGGGRWAVIGTSYDPNDAGAIMVVFLPLIVAMTWRERGVWRICGLLGALACLAVIGRSGSRGAAVAIAAVLVTFAMSFRGRKMLASVALAAVVGVGAWVASPATIKERVVATFFSDEQTYDETEYHGRKNIWARGIRYFVERPITGVGLSNYGIREGEELGGRAGRWYTAHNSHLQVLVETGVAGMLPYAMLIFLSWRTASRSFRQPYVTNDQSSQRPELMASLVAFIVAGTFLSHGYSFYLYALHALFMNQQRAWRLRPTKLTQTELTPIVRKRSVFPLPQSAN